MVPWGAAFVPALKALITKRDNVETNYSLAWLCVGKCAVQVNLGCFAFKVILPLQVAYSVPRVPQQVTSKPAPDDPDPCAG